MRVSFLVLLVSLSCAHSLFGAPPSIVSETSPKIPLASTTKVSVTSPREQVSLLLSRLNKAIQEKNEAEGYELLQEIEKIKEVLRIENLEEDSIGFLTLAQAKWEEGDKTQTALLIRTALNLSPSSPGVLLQSLRLAHLTKVQSFPSQIWKITESIWSDTDFLLRAIKVVSYPILWAITLSLYLTLIFTLAFNIELLMRGVAKIMPTGTRGFTTPLASFLLLIFPCFWGPLWGISLWAVLILLFLPHYRWLGFLAGVVLVAWGSVVPLRENITDFLKQEGVTTLLRVSRGQFELRDQEILEKFLQTRANDPLVSFALARVYLREKNFEEATRYLSKAEALSPNLKRWIDMERGMLYFVQGDSKKADELLAAVENTGYKSAEFLFNYSKIKFDLTDTVASSNYFSKAFSSNPNLIEKLKALEEESEIHDTLSFAYPKISLGLILSSAFLPSPHFRIRSTVVTDSLMIGMTPLWVGILGSCFILWFLFRGEHQKPKRGTFYPRYIPPFLLVGILRAFPGGGLVLKGRPGRCFALWSLCFFLVFPALGWPSESKALAQYFVFILPVYLCLLALLFLSLGYIGYHHSKEGEE